MENPEMWKEELERVEGLQEEKKVLPFGYDYILEELNEISLILTSDTLFSGGVLLGRLIEVIIENKDKE